MQAFLRESLQLLYYSYFKPLTLQTWLNRVAPQEDGDTSFLQLLLESRTDSEAQKFLLQCVLWWILGLLPFWCLAWKSIHWEGMTVVSGIIVVAAFSMATVSFPLGMALPLLSGIVWSLGPELWATLQENLVFWLDPHIVGFTAINLILGVPLGLGLARATALKSKRLAVVLTVVAAVLPFSIYFGVATLNSSETVLPQVSDSLSRAGRAGFALLFELMFIISMIYSSLAAIRFISSQGESGKLEESKTAVNAILLGYATMMLSILGIFAMIFLSTLPGPIMLCMVISELIGISGIVTARNNADRVAFVVTFFVASGVVIVEAFNLTFAIGDGLTGLIVGLAAIAVALFVVFTAISLTVARVTGPALAMIVVGILIAAFILASSIAVFGAGGTTLPLIPALGLVLGLGFFLSPHRSLRLGLVLAPTVAALFIEPQGWGVGGLILGSFLVGYFRLPLYPVALLATAFVSRWSRLHSRKVPDEVVWLRLYGLDRLLVVVTGQSIDRREQNDAITRIAESISQEWAIQPALLQLSLQSMAHYDTVTRIPSALVELTWLCDKPKVSRRSMTEVCCHLVEIVHQVETALVATNNYNRLRRLNQARDNVQDLQGFLDTLKRRTRQLFIPIAESWEQLISAEITRLSVEQEIKADIPNPYITGTPVQPDHKAMFAPRPDLLRRVKRALTATHDKPTLALYGPRRMGKTTFLLQLPRLLPDEVIPVFVDLQEAVQVSSMGGLYYKWAIAAVKAAHEWRRLILPQPKLDIFGAKPVVAWSDWLDEAEIILEDRNLLFTFDEFERLVDAAEKNPEMEGAFSILRHLSQHRPHVYFLFAGAHRLEELAPHGRWHDYFINVRGLEVSYLDEVHARRLITDPTPDFPLGYAPGAEDDIIRLTHCQPMLVQLMGSLLVDWLNSPTRRECGDWLTATLEDIAHAASEILSAGHSAYFASLWHDAGEDGQRVLRALAQMPDGLPEESIQQQSGLGLGRLREVLTRLVQYRLVEQVEGRWRIQVELTRRAFARF